MAVITAYGVGDQHQPGARTATQQQFRIQYEDESIRPYINNPHKQTMIDLEYFVKSLRLKGHETTLFVNANEGVEHIFRPQGHRKVFKTDNGLHVNGNIDAPRGTFMENWGLENKMATIHGPDVPNTHIRGSTLFSCGTIPSLGKNINEVGLLDFDTLCKNDHIGIFIDLDIQGVFGTPPNDLPHHSFGS
jgi:hypothetical protein